MNIRITAPGPTGGRTISDASMKDRLLAAGTELFGENGYAGTSVRDICNKAGASVPMISHYFGGKQGLYDAVIGQVSAETFDVPLRMLQGELRSREEFLTKFELFISETFAALMSLAPVFRIIIRDGAEFADLSRLHEQLSTFLIAAQEKGYLRESLKTELTTGMIMDRLCNQILFSVNPKYKGPNVVSDAAFRKDWLAANIEALLFGLAGKP